jgi:hypothetical protein
MQALCAQSLIWIKVIGTKTRAAGFSRLTLAILGQEIALICHSPGWLQCALAAEVMNNQSRTRRGAADCGEHCEVAGAANKPAGCIITLATSEGG